MNLLLRLEFDGERRTTSRLTELLLPATYKNRQRKLVWEVKENSGVPQTVFFQLAGKSNVHSKSFILQAVSGMSGVKRVAFAKNVQAALSKVGSQASGQGGRSRAQAQADTAKTLSRSAATPEDEDEDEDDFGDCMHCHGRFYGAAFMDHESTCTANPHPARSRKRPAPAPEARESVSTTATAALESLRQAQMALTSADNSLGLAEQAEEASGAGTPSARSVPAAQGRPRPRDHAATRDQPKRGGEAGGAREQRRAADEANPHPTWTVQAFVDHIGKKLWNVEGEGNCFFLAVLLALDLISRELAMKPDAETNNNVQEMRKRAVEHIKQHFLDATNPLAGVYGKLIATCLASNATRLQGDGPTDPKRLEALKKQVEYDVRLLERNNEWQPEQGYVFEFMIWAVACLVQKPILCFEPKSSLDDKLYPYFKVYGDSWEKGTMMDACAPFAKLHKLPALRDYDLSDGAGECANKDAILLNTRQYIMLYFRNSHFWCISRSMEPGLATAVTNGGRRVSAPDVEQQRSLESRSDDRACVSASTAAATAPVMRAPAPTAVRAPTSMCATVAEESRAVPETSGGQSGRSRAYSDVDRVTYVKTLASKLVPGIELGDIDHRSRFGPSLSMLLCIHCEAVIVTTMPLQRHRPHCRLCQHM